MPRKKKQTRPKIIELRTMEMPSDDMLITKPATMDNLNGGDMRRTIIARWEQLMIIDYIADRSGAKIKDLYKSIFADYIARYEAENGTIDVPKDYAEEWKTKRKFNQ